MKATHHHHSHTGTILTVVAMVLTAAAASASPPPCSVLTESVVFDADVDATGCTGAVYTLGADDIVIDGAGHRITAPDASSVFSFSGRSGIAITDFAIETHGTVFQADYAQDATLTQASVSGPATAAMLRWSNAITIDGITASGSRLETWWVSNCTVADSDFTGAGILFYYDDGGNVIRGNDVSGSPAQGIQFVGVGQNNVIENNLARDCGSGIGLCGDSTRGRDNIVRGNDCSDSRGTAIGIGTCDAGPEGPYNTQVRGNKLDGAAGTALQLAAALDTQVEGNTYAGATTGFTLIRANADVFAPEGNIRDLDLSQVATTAVFIQWGHGVTISNMRAPGKRLETWWVSGCTVADSDFTGAGILFYYDDGGNVLRGNDVSGSPAQGIQFVGVGSNNLIEDNLARDCGGGISLCGDETRGRDNVIRGNDCSSAGGFAIGVGTCDAGPAGPYNTQIRGNKLDGAAGTALQLAAALDTQVEGNTYAGATTGFTLIRANADVFAPDGNIRDLDLSQVATTAVFMQWVHGVTVSNMRAPGKRLETWWVSDCTVADSDFSGAGIRFYYDDGGNVIRGNDVSGSPAQGIQFVIVGSNNLIEDNRATNCDNGISLCGDSTRGRDNVVRDNDCSDARGTAIGIGTCDAGPEGPFNTQVRGNKLDRAALTALGLTAAVATQVEGNSYAGAQTGFNLQRLNGDVIGPDGNIRDVDLAELGPVASHALYLRGCHGLTITGLNAPGAGIEAWSTGDTLVEDSNLTDGGILFYYSPGGNVIRRNDVSGTPGNGIHFHQAGPNTVIEDNRADDCEGTSIALNTAGAGCVIRGNRAEGSSGAGLSLFYVTECLVEENTFQGNLYGLFLYQNSASTIWHNNIFQNRLNVNVIGGGDRQLSLDGEGNFWGHDCPDLFLPGIDSNLLTVVDSHPYGRFDAWKWGMLPGVCGQAPVAEAGPDQEVEQTSPEGAEVTLDGSGSFDPDGDSLTYDWDYDLDGYFDASGVVVTETFARGTHTVLLRVTDSTGMSDTDEVQIIVRDTTPPDPLSVTASPWLLWPPDHQMVPVEIFVQLEDLGDPEPTARIIRVTSSEPVIGEGDRTQPDWEVTGPLTLLLRAERSGQSKDGRIYTITVECEDDSHNRTTVTTTAVVPHDMRK